MKLPATPDDELDVAAVRSRFPALNQDVHGQPLVYLDNAATTQKPDTVLQAMDNYYQHDNSNVHRAVHALSSRATQSYEGARDEVAAFINAPSREQLIFTRGTTESINIVAHCFAGPLLVPGDEILITHLEHHSNIVPWQMVCGATGAELKVAPVDDRGVVDIQAFEQLLSTRTRLVAVAESSNAIGTRNPLAEMTRLARQAGALMLVDAAQAAAHRVIDVVAMDVDFLALSAHKMFGPTGVGALYGRSELLERMQPWQGGGDMIEKVSFSGTTWNELPYRFEAGTPNIAGVVGFGAAVRFIQDIGHQRIANHENKLLDQATAQLSQIDGLRIIGTAPDKVAIISFVMDGAHAHDIGTLLDENGIAVRTGHHCAMPLMEHFGLAGTARASFACYNTDEEVARLAQALQRIGKLFA